MLSGKLAKGGINNKLIIAGISVVVIIILAFFFWQGSSEKIEDSSDTISETGNTDVESVTEKLLC